MSDAPERVWVAINHGLKYPYHVGMATDYKWSKDSHEYVRADIHEAEIDRLREAIGRMQCTCLPYAKPGDGMCDRCMALEADDE